MRAYSRVPAACTVIVLVTALFGCGATIPQIEVWRPWTRTLGSTTELPAGVNVITECSGSTEPLFGPSQPMENDLKKVLDNLLRRRGYHIDSTDALVRIVLHYKTESVELLSASSKAQSLSFSETSIGTASGTGRAGGLGVSIAAAVASLANVSFTRSETSVESDIGYVHSLEIKITDTTGRDIWSGQSYWFDESVDIKLHALAAIQLIVSGLPTSGDAIPAAPELKADRIDRYILDNCSDISYSCPSLPYDIYFELYRWKNAKKVAWAKDIYSGDLSTIPAVIDLIQTAEYALPTGRDVMEDPTDPSNWEKAILGSRYRLGPKENIMNVIVELFGTNRGYRIDRAGVVSDEEFADFQRRMAKWRAQLDDYYDIYK